MGKLRRKRVCVLSISGVERPSDDDGGVFAQLECTPSPTPRSCAPCVLQNDIDDGGGSEEAAHQRRCGAPPSRQRLCSELRSRVTLA